MRLKKRKRARKDNMADEEKKDEVKEEKKEEAPKEEEKPVAEVKTEVSPAVKEEERPVEAPKEVKKAKPALTGKHSDLIKEIEKMSVADLAELVKALEDRLGVSAAPVAVAAPTAGGTPAAAVAEAPAAAGKASYTVHLAASGDQKIAVIKILREINPALGLKEAKDLVDGAPKDVAQNVAAEDAQKAKEKLEAAGAKVELK